ncbi:MAG: polyphosphate kinase 1 [Oligoflexales bacterium]
MEKNNQNRFLNRELSWLDFNSRVLNEASLAETPVLEKLRFCCIFSRNLEEFFMVRVAGIQAALNEGELPWDHHTYETSEKLLDDIENHALKLRKKCHDIVTKKIFPTLEKEGIFLKHPDQWTPKERKKAHHIFSQKISPLMTPLVVDAAHPYPFLTNQNMYLMFIFDDSPTYSKGFIQIPDNLPEVFEIDHGVYSLTTEITRCFIEEIIFGPKIIKTYYLRVIRNLDYNLHESSISDLLTSIKTEVQKREFQEVIRLEIDKHTPKNIVKEIQKILKINDEKTWNSTSPYPIHSLLPLCQLHRPDLKFPSFTPRIPTSVYQSQSKFDLIKEKDILLHHPYESFSLIIDFIQEAAKDSFVRSIKITLYRVTEDSPILESLIEAAERGKLVTVIVEIKARFDEKNNIYWARKLEKKGVRVIYGTMGLKIHCKACLITREEDSGFQTYAHLSTGNYNDQTAKSYTDLGLLTCRHEITKEVNLLFNIITGYNIFRKDTLFNKVPLFKTIAVAPLNLRKKTIKEIKKEISSHKIHKNGCIVAKINGLEDREIIEALYQASCSGVKITLLVRGICCLKTNIPKVSENITVISIIDRFLEHSRIFYFHSNKNPRLFLGSCDWMNRNMDRRIELMFPILDPDLVDRVYNEILHTYLNDKCKSHILNPNGTWESNHDNQDKSQQKFIDIARKTGIQQKKPHDLRKKKS